MVLSDHARNPSLAQCFKMGPCDSDALCCPRSRSMSFDNTAGRSIVAGEPESGCSSSFCRMNQVLEAIESEKQASVWRFCRRSSIRTIGGATGEDQIKDLSVPLVNSNDRTMPKWKEILTKLRSTLKSAFCPNFSSNLREVLLCGSIAISIKKVKLPLESEKQNPHVHPEPSALHSSIPPLWERRKAAQPATLDLRKLKVTGMNRKIRR